MITSVQQTSQPRIKVDIWSDIACPWCYVGKRRFEAALAKFPQRDQVEVVWHSFELDSSAPLVNPMNARDNLAAKYGKTSEGAQKMLDHMTGDCKDVLGYVTIEPADETGFVPYAAYAAVRNPDASQENVITSTLTYS